MRSTPIKFDSSVLLLSLCLLTAGCQQGDSLDRIQSEGELLVVTRNSPTTYYQDKDGPTGFEYALAELLAQDLGVALNVQPEFSLDAIFLKLRRKEAHLAAAGLTLTGQRMNEFPHSQPYYQLKPQVVYVAGTYRPREPADLTGMSIAVLAGSSNAGHVAL